MQRAAIMAISLSVLPGCLGSHQDVPPGVLKNLTRTVIEEPHVQRQNSSPYDAREVAPIGKEEQGPPPSVVPVKHTEPAVPMSMKLESRPPLPPAPPIPVSPPQVPASPPAPEPIPLAVAKPSDPVKEALHLYRENRVAEGTERLKCLEPGRRELLAVLLPVVAQLADQHEKGARTVDCTPLLTSLEEVIQAIRARSVLSLEKVCFCRGIERFGVFDPLPFGHIFQIGAEGRPGELVQLYAELKNFVCRRGEAGYETSLACTLVLRDGHNRIVWRQDRPAQIERSRSPCRDCYLGCHFCVPPGLPVGDYSMTVQVSDLTGFNADETPVHRTASRSLEFRVGSP